MGPDSPNAEGEQPVKGLFSLCFFLAGDNIAEFVGRQ